ncbi:MAG: hypothetical protein KGV51_03720 [Moraxellaceae bacterium]|nr:hypothetical protein [Moraxellaceae bacterium]
MKIINLSKLALIATIITTAMTGCATMEEARNRPMSCFEIAKKIGNLEAQLDESDASATVGVLGATFGSTKKKREHYETDYIANSIVSGGIQEELNFYRSRYNQQGCRR